MNELTTDDVAGDVVSIAPGAVASPSTLGESTLDPEREWLSVTCDGCGAPAKIHNGPGNVVSVPETVMAELPDGTTIPVVVDREVPAPTLRWECGRCGKIQLAQIVEVAG